MTTAMLSVSEALARVLADFHPLESEIVAAESAVGRVLAEPVRASINLPPFPNSSMDGYAVRAKDVAAATADAPVALSVVGDIPAGVAPTVEVRAGTAARIMTGAQMPPGADAVIPVEATDDSRATMGAGGQMPSAVRVLKSVDKGAYVRYVGEDVRAGDEVLAAGVMVRPYDLGVLTALGVGRVPVVRRPRVGILSTGDELVDIDQTPGAGQIRNVNGYTLAALVRKYGGEPVSLGVARDQFEDVHQKLLTAVEQNLNLIISSAGVSVGAYDVVKMAVEREGALNFWKVNMRPGKPLVYGQVRGIPFFGLPGNPVSAIVGFEIFVRPALLKLGGRGRLQKPVVKATLSETLHSDGRESYLRAVVTRENGGYTVRSAGGQGSNIVSALAHSNAFLILPEGVTEAQAGTTLSAWMLDWPEEVF
jgi:molybdopterin molybdotransferase